jgi:RNA polymerase sigma factor (sigma-70 family)
VHIYAPVVFGFARKRGLQEADAADLTQEVLRTVAGSAGRLDYDPRRGAFRSWLYTIARNRIHDFFAARRRETPASGDSAVQVVLEQQPAPDPDDDSALWREEYEQGLFHVAAQKVRGDFEESTWQAFWQVAVEAKPAADVADTLGLTLGAVYIAKSRVLARLKKQIGELQAE